MARKIVSSPAGSPVLGRIPEGCGMCIKGEKLVLFVHGICHRCCFYCPLSGKRKGKRTTSANEKEVLTDKDVLEEARLCDARGAGITGGEPLINIENTLHYIKLLKKEFGSTFHTHLYTSGDHASDDALKALKEAGLDEIRYHLRHDNWDIVKKAIGRGFDVGVEIPCIPGELDYLKKLVVYLDNNGVKFLNLNELEMSELSSEKMFSMGFRTDGQMYNSVVGSRKTAMSLLKFASENTKRISVHFCMSYVKDSFQFKNRLKRRAKNIRKPFEKISSGFLLKKGAVLTESPLDTIKDLCVSINLKQSDYCIRPDRKRIEMSVENAKKAASAGFEAQAIEEIPTADPFDMEAVPLKGKKKRQEPPRP